MSVDTGSDTDESTRRLNGPTPQLSLFDSDSDAPPDRLAALELASSPDDVVDVARRLPSSLRLGTMSWTYPGWIGVLYAQGTSPKQLAHRGLGAYTRHPLLRAVEIDRTFYDPISAEDYSRYAAQVPDDFRFAAKAHEECTLVRFPPHARYGARAGQANPRLLDAAYATDRVVAPFVAGLGAKAGPLVFQFPPFEVRSPARFADRLHDFLGRLPRGPSYAVEVRNAELLTEAYGAALADTGALHCHNAWGRMPDVLAQRARLLPATRRTLVVRWLSRPSDTHESARRRFLPFNRLVEEDRSRREQLATLVRDSLRERAEVYVLVSNKAEGCAPESLRRLAAAIAGEP